MKREQDDDEDPGVLGETAHATAVDHQDVDDREHQQAGQDERDEHADHDEQSRSALSRPA